jgi:hypothetical protein
MGHQCFSGGGAESRVPHSCAASAGAPFLRSKGGGRSDPMTAPESSPSPTLRQERRMGHQCLRTASLRARL